MHGILRKAWEAADAFMVGPKSPTLGKLSFGNAISGILKCEMQKIMPLNGNISDLIRRVVDW